MQLKDPLRTEISPFTGEYYKVCLQLGICDVTIAKHIFSADCYR